jgi:hypothetical protein
MSHLAGREAATVNDWAAKSVLPVMAATIFVSAFLLFSVQPFFAKMVLPRLGGSPAVWSVAMVFFQSMLLAGYGYAHILTKRMTLKSAVIVHLTVLAAAAAALPIAIPDSWSNPPEDGQALWLIGLFSVSVGLPFFAVSANSSLLQGWFSRTGHAHARDPYFLYGASNTGSFASLILYIVVFEPLATLPQQNGLWTIGFMALIVLIALSGCLAMSLSSANGQAGPADGHGAPQSHAAPIEWKQRFSWISYAFVPSALLVAVTAHVQTDVAAAPFLWLVPLALFLLTFVIVFQKQPLIPHRIVEKVAPFLVIPLLYVTLNPVHSSLIAQISGHFLTFFAVALCAHGALAARRPDAAHLTEFYFCMSAGGVLGGVFSSLVALHLFTWIAEYPLLLILSLLTIPLFRGEGPLRRVIAAIAAAAAAAGILTLIDTATSAHPLSDYNNLQVLNGALGLSALYLLFRRATLVPALCLMMFANTYVFVSYFYSAVETRSFFGVLRVADDAGAGVRKFQHGTTLHGAARLSDLAADVKRPVPLTYYSDDGGMSAAIRAVRQNLGGKIGRAGVIGVGAGSLACQFSADEKLDLFEIDPQVVRIAQDPSLFPFLSKCAPGAKMIIGDGRIKLEEISDRSYDVLVVDAFSSDSIPVHLLTLEAIDLYMRKLSQNGVLIFHISNKHLELKSVVGAIGRALGLSVRVAQFIPQNSAETLGMATPSDVAVIARNDVVLGHVLDDKRWQIPVLQGVKAWTDGYSNLIAALWRRYSR